MFTPEIHQHWQGGVDHLGFETRFVEYDGYGRFLSIALYENEKGDNKVPPSYGWLSTAARISSTGASLPIPS